MAKMLCIILRGFFKCVTGCLEKKSVLLCPFNVLLCHKSLGLPAVSGAKPGIPGVPVERRRVAHSGTGILPACSSRSSACQTNVRDARATTSGGIAVALPMQFVCMARL